MRPNGISLYIPGSLIYIQDNHTQLLAYAISQGKVAYESVLHALLKGQCTAPEASAHVQQESAHSHIQGVKVTAYSSHLGAGEQDGA